MNALRVILRALELRRGFRGAEDAQSGRAERVDDAGGERRLGSDDRERDRLLRRERHEVGDRGAGNVRELGLARGAAVARRHEHLRDARRLRDLPRERMLASAAADDEDVHADRLKIWTQSRITRPKT